MDIPLKVLDTQEFRELWEKNTPSAFVHSFAVIVRNLFFERLMFYNTSVVFPYDMRTSLVHGIECDTFRSMAWDKFASISRDASCYVADNVLLAKVEKILSFWDRCEAHLRYYACRGWKTWCGDMQKCRIIRRHKRQTSLTLSEQDLWSLAVALYVRKGLGTTESFASMVCEVE